MVPGRWPARVVSSQPGPGTMTGDGDILTDENGSRWRVISEAEASIARNSTGGYVATVSRGFIR